MIVAIRIFTNSVGVEIVELSGTQQVFYSLVVHTLVGGQLESHVPYAVLGQLHLVGRGQRQIQVVVVVCLNEVRSIAAILGNLLVSIVHAVEVQLTVSLAAHHIVAGTPEISIASLRTSALVVAVPYIVVARWHVLPVVGLWLLYIMIVQARVLIYRIATSQHSGKLGFLVDVPVPREHHAWLEVVNDTRTALLAVLVAPVGVVVTVVGQPVHFVCRSTLSGALSGVTPCDERYGVLVVQLLLGSKVIGERVVECTLDVGCLHIGPTIGYIGRECPPVRAQTAVVGIDST